jgi:hypothetical protein
VKLSPEEWQEYGRWQRVNSPGAGTGGCDQLIFGIVGTLSLQGGLGQSSASRQNDVENSRAVCLNWKTQMAEVIPVIREYGWIAPEVLDDERGTEETAATNTPRRIGGC